MCEGLLASASRDNRSKIEGATWHFSTQTSSECGVPDPPQSCGTSPDWIAVHGTYA